MGRALDMRRKIGLIIIVINVAAFVMCLLYETMRSYCQLIIMANEYRWRWKVD